MWPYTGVDPITRRGFVESDIIENASLVNIQDSKRKILAEEKIAMCF